MDVEIFQLDQVVVEQGGGDVVERLGGFLVGLLEEGDQKHPFISAEFRYK